MREKQEGKKKRKKRGEREGGGGGMLRVKEPVFGFDDGARVKQQRADKSF